MDTALTADLLTHMQEVNILSHWWLGAVAIQKWQKEECMETVARTAKAVLGWAAKVASSGKQEEASVPEQEVCLVVPSPAQELADKPPMTELPSEEQESVLSTGQKQKVSSLLF